MLTLDGISQPFDENSSGFIRSEAICVVFLQKIEAARRNYATIVNIGTANDGFKIAGAAVPSQQDIQNLQTRVYREANINPSDIRYVESHAASTHVGDKIQVDCIDAVFCGEERRTPLLIGSVKSNTGHTESSSGLVSLAKTIFMFENEKIIPNINIKRLRDDCDALTQGRIKVAMEVEEFYDDFIGIDNFGILGANSHCIIRKNHKSKRNNGLANDELPRLLLWSGKTNDNIDYVFDSIISRPLDDEFMALLQASQRFTHASFNCRGFAIFETNKLNNRTHCLDRKIKEVAVKEKRPIVFMFSGVGAQWLTMGRDLLKIPMLAERIDDCHRILEPVGVNLKNMLISTDPTTFESCQNIFIGVTAIQIALIDLLKKLGITPDYFIGHSLGELACAYADDSLTAEQTMMSAYLRGKCVMDRCSQTGGMAAVAMQHEALMKVLPDGLEIACFNSTESFTVSGDANKINTFAENMKINSVPVRVLDSSGIAFHSFHVQYCKDEMLRVMSDLIKEPKKRSDRWISTSIDDDKIDFSLMSSFASAEYFTNNLLNPVKFSDCLAKLPRNSLVIEVAPHALLLGISKKMIPDGDHIGLTQRNSIDGVLHLLQAIGKIYQCGIDIDIRQIYPKIEFPVSRGTRMIAPLVKWNHSESHFVPLFNPIDSFGKRNVSVNLYMPKYSYLSHHVIDGELTKLTK